jgi:hypothetical protein
MAAAPVAADQAGRAQQAGDPLAANVDVMVQAQLSVDPGRAIGAPAALMDDPDLGGQLGILSGPSAWWPPHPGVLARARHTQHAAQQGDSMVWLLLIDQPEDHRR